MAKVFLSWITSFLSFLTLASSYEIDVKELSGKWYPVKTVTSDPGPKHLYAFVIHPMDDRTAAMEMQIPQNKQCTLKKVTLTKMTPYVLFSAEGQLAIMDADYDNYLFVECNKGKSRSLSLYARKTTVSKEVKQKFKTFVKNSALKSEHKFKLRKEDMCKTPPVNP